MRRRALVAAAGSMLAAAGLASGCGDAALSTNQPPKAISPAAHTVVSACGGRAQVRPAALVLACGDAGDELARLRWRGWGGASATATGTEIVAVCVPDCVAGRTEKLPVRVTVSQLALQGTQAAYKLLVVHVMLEGDAALPSGVALSTRYTLGPDGPALVAGR